MVVEGSFAGIVSRFAVAACTSTICKTLGSTACRRTGSSKTCLRRAASIWGGGPPGSTLSCATGAGGAWFWYWLWKSQSPAPPSPWQGGQPNKNKSSRCWQEFILQRRKAFSHIPTLLPLSQMQIHCGAAQQVRDGIQGLVRSLARLGRLLLHGSGWV